MKRMRLKEPVVFDLNTDDYEDTFRVRIDDNGIMLWKKAVGNLDEPRSLDKFIKISWEHLAKSGYAYYGTRTGHVERGPADSRCGLGYLTHKNK